MRTESGKKREKKGDSNYVLCYLRVACLFRHNLAVASAKIVRDFLIKALHVKPFVVLCNNQPYHF